MAINRRKFIKSMVLTASGMLVPLYHIPGFAAGSSIGGMKRRHLINIIGAGGWDTSWLHNSISSASLSTDPNVSISDARNGFDPAIAISGKLLYTRKTSDANDRELFSYTHRLGTQLMGPATGYIFGGSGNAKPNIPSLGSYNPSNPTVSTGSVDTSSTLTNLLIWRGIDTAALSHETGNKVILHGGISPYSLSFSEVIAAALAADSPRPLHYVALADTPDNLFTFSAMASGFSKATCIPDVTTFGAVTATNAHDLPTNSLRGLLSNAIGSLTTTALGSSVTLAGSQSAVSGFRANFDGGVAVYGANIPSSPEFQYLWYYYIWNMAQAIGNLKTEGTQNVMNRAALVPMNTTVSCPAGGYIPSRTIADAITALSTQFQSMPIPPDYPTFRTHLAKDPNFYTALFSHANWGGISLGLDSNTSGAGSAHWELLRTNAYFFAFADYLVRNNLSAVVDIPAWPGIHGSASLNQTDMHYWYVDEILSITRAVAGYRTLVESLKSVNLDQGGTLLDATLVIMHSEFDRNSWHNSTGPTVALNFCPGTDHAPTASILLAGYNVDSGKIMGDLYNGSILHPNFAHDGIGYRHALPVDSAGTPTPLAAGGHVTTLYSVFPTVMALFGVSMPPQQLTTFGPINSVIKKVS